MLLIDGVKYKLWSPANEAEFENIVSDHAQDIWGEGAKYFDLKHKLASKIGTGSIPDGYVITLGDNPKVCIIEFELATHSLQHIVSQIINIINGIENAVTQQKICNAIEDDIYEDSLYANKISKVIKPVSIHRFLSDSFSNVLPTYIVIDKNWPALDEAMNKVTPSPKIIEFQTYIRMEGGLSIHAHQFEPLQKTRQYHKHNHVSENIINDSFEVNLVNSCIKYYNIYVPKEYRSLFPESKTELEIETDIGLLNVIVNSDVVWGIRIGKGLVNWFHAHRELKEGNKVRVSVIEPMKKYHLEIVK